MNTPTSLSKAPCISVIDDDESVREAIKSLLESTGFRASLFASAEEFLNCMQPENTRCLIVDVQMSGMSGIELQAELSTRDSRIPIIFITAHDDEHLRSRALKAGAVEMLIKPFTEEDLLNGIHSAIQNRAS